MKTKIPHQEHLAFSLKSLTRGSVSFPVSVSVCCCQDEGDVGKYFLLCVCVHSGWVMGGGGRGSLSDPQNWVRGINILTWLIGAEVHFQNC